MYIEAREGTFRVRIRRKGAPDTSRTFTDRDAAAKWGSDVEAAIRNGTLPELLNRDTTVGVLLAEYGEKVTPKKKGAKQERRRLAALRRSKIADYTAVNVTPRVICEYRDRLQGRGVSGSTINRELALISAVLKWARSQRGVPAPLGLVQGLKMPENGARKRRLRPGELERLLATAPDWLQSYITLAIETTCRRGELVALEWRDVDLSRRRITLRETKNGDTDVPVPLSTRAVEALQRLPRGIGATRVFPWHPDVVSHAFIDACKAARVVGLRLHDLRAEGVSRLFERGLDLASVRAISRHKSTALLRYVRAGDVDELVRRLG